MGLLLLFSFLPSALAFVASQALPQSLWGERHLIIVASPLDFYLKAAREGRFQIRTVKDIGDVNGEHFRVAFRDTTWTQGRKPQEILRAEGYSVGDDLVAGTPEQRVILFPVRRQ